MTQFYVRHIIKDKESEELVSVSLDLDFYCKTTIDKLFNAIREFEEISGKQISDNKLLKSNLFDAIGMVKRLPRNIYIDGDNNEEL